MSPFTDDNLKRLMLSSRPMDYVEAMPALIARLEAAENVVEEVRWRTEESTVLMDAIEAWRKAAGK